MYQKNVVLFALYIFLTIGTKTRSKMIQKMFQFFIEIYS